MERVAIKLKRGEALSSQDMTYWISYNFLALPIKEQDKLKTIFERQQWYFRRMAFIMPPLFYATYAILRYQMTARLLPNLIISGLFVLGVFKFGMISSNTELKKLQTEIFLKYQYEVIDPKYRGLKLSQGKKAYQMDNKDFTSSNLEDLKQLIMK